MEILFLFTFISVFSTAFGICYFPVEFQGIFSTQASLAGGKTHKYSQITILPDAIPVWGVCHEMNDTKVILHDATGGQDCFRCFHVTLHSPNIIQVYTEGLDKCYMNSESARMSCPSIKDIRNRSAREIMLYKSRSFTQDGQIDRLTCPFSGKYHFTYNVNDGTETSVECPDSNSVLSNCPKGSELQLSFKQCRFEDTNMTLRCLGEWKGIDGYQYFALWDTRSTSEEQPQYRCAMYHVDKDTGRIFIAFSIDATCTNHLLSPWDGYETMVLTPVKRPSPPAPVHAYSCSFPQWANGKWKDIQIRGRNLWWNDYKRDKVYQTLCLSQNNPNQERYALYSLNQCGDEEFTCIWIKKRDEDVFEFKIATVQYNYFNNTRICADDVFIGQTWNTQGRLTDSQKINCPVLGEYTGVIPDATDLCANLASDCQNPALMHFTVSSCENSTQVYENRYYQCLGQWKESGIMYTYTYRLDVRTYECFAGVVINDNEAFIIEAGVNCERGLQPLVKGMKLVRKASCDETSNEELTTKSTNTLHSTKPTSRPAFPAWWPSTSRKPWLKKSTTTTQKPPWKNQKPRDLSSSATNITNSIVLICIILTLYLSTR